jgi:hypothetical protein
VRSRASTALTAVAAALAAAAAVGCGLGPGPGTSNVSLTITRGFGSRPLGSITQAKVPGSETVMRMLERSFRVQTRYGGGFVESINGLSGNSSRLDWFYYVNGIEATLGAAGTAVHRGDRIWWDLHDWAATNSVPAVVGSFPEPFLHGVGGRRFPTTVECAPDSTSACTTVTNALSRDGVPVASQLFGTGSGTDSLNVLVGTWRELQPLLAADLIEHGPASSGVYARFAASGASLELLDPRGDIVRTLSGDAGLVAATADHAATPTWIIAGTDAAGVRAAADALTPARLRDHFALAVSGNTDLPVPLEGNR